MKKFFAIAFIAASLVACNEGTKETEVTNVDTTQSTIQTDTTTITPAPMDTTGAAMVDTTTTSTNTTTTTTAPVQ